MHAENQAHDTVLPSVAGALRLWRGARAQAPDEGEVDVSVIVTTFHRERLVVEAIRSALAQHGVSLEVIVVDDSAEGSARDAVASIDDPRVTYVKRDVPSGGRPAMGRNEGLRLARGRYVSFLDDDDHLFDGALAALMAPLELHPEVGVTFGMVVPFGDEPGAVERERVYFERGAAVVRRARGRTRLNAALLFKNSPLVTSACLMRRADVLALGGFDPSIAMCEDLKLFGRAVRSLGGLFVEYPVLHHRTGLSSISTNIKQDETLAAYRSIFDEYRKRFGSLEFYALKGLSKLM
jgi:glycosyltransferase involved in cell wall biosynthesis